MSTKKKGQTWSIEAYIAVGLFLLVIVFFYSYIVTKSTDTNLEQESDFVSRKLAKDILSDNVIDAEELATLGDIAGQCQALQQMLGTSKQACIYFEDDQGRLIPIEDSSGNRYYGIGCSGGLVVDSVECGNTIPVT